MPCFNHARFLADSVDGVLRQTYPDVELIIVDDCSRDGSWAAISELARKDQRIKPVRHEQNQGASKSRNDGLEMAAGDFIAFCDADDIWEIGKLTAQIELLRRNPEYDIVYGDTHIIDETARQTGRRFSEKFPPPKRASGWLFEELAVRNFVNIQSVLMRKNCLAGGERFDRAIKWVEDWWFWIELSREHQFLYLETPLARYRVHSRSTNLVQKRGYRVNRFKVFKRILAEYPDLPGSLKAEIAYRMGVELWNLGKRRMARRLFQGAVGHAGESIRGYPKLCQLLPRIARTMYRQAIEVAE